MRKTDRDKRNYIIVGLCAIVLMMVVGYASFASQLTINGTAEVTSSWCLGFDSTQGTVTPVKGLSTGASPSGTISYNGNSCGTKAKVASTITADLKQPGDEVTYTLTIINEGTVAAAIKSITVNNENITANKTIREGNIIFTVEMPGKTSLTSNETTTMNIKAKFQNETDITGAYTVGDEASINVKINAEEDNGSGGIVPTPAAQTVYAINTNSIYKDSSSLADIGQTYNSCAATGKPTCLKYTIENNIVTGADVCFMKGGTEICLKGWVDESSLETTPVFNSNKSVLQRAFTEEDACDDHGPSYGCDASGWRTGADVEGGVNANDGSWECYVDSAGNAYCRDFWLD